MESSHLAQGKAGHRLYWCFPVVYIVNSCTIEQNNTTQNKTKQSKGANKNKTKMKRTKH
jgi:hypothetical protein